MISSAEERYLRAIYQISQAEYPGKCSLNELSLHLGLKAPTVLERIRNMEKARWLTYTREKGILLSPSGYKKALQVVRKHRIWETFLQKVCKFNWSEVHELAELLQQVNSDKLLDRIFVLSGEPRFDPHGDPIPDKEGSMPPSQRRPLLESTEGCRCTVLGVLEDSPDFLNYLSELHIGLNEKIQVERVFGFDGSMKVRYKNHENVLLSPKVAEKIMVQCNKTDCSCKTKKGPPRGSLFK
ncbi:MAG TPA: metal-dependent transcriptional regulator [Bacteroidia bacterium]|nr:metal-dependent transcriptional regulator [Bacteroidia bacterium]